MSPPGGQDRPEGGPPPLVSVVIPAYDSARTLPATVASALGQTLADLEVIVVDDGSSDDTRAIAEAIDDPRLRVIGKANGGSASARNAGIGVARGEWVALLDADDLWLPEKLERQLAVARARPELVAVHSGVFRVDDRLSPQAIRTCDPARDTLIDYLMFRNLPGAMSTLVARREALEAAGLFDATFKILDDWDMMIKLIRLGPVTSVPEPLTLYRVHAGNIGRNLDIHVDPGYTVLRRLFADPGLAPEVRAREREIYARFFTMMTGGAFKVRRWRDCAAWGLRALRADPRMALYMAQLPVRRARTLLERRRGAAGDGDVGVPASYHALVGSLGGR